MLLALVIIVLPLQENLPAIGGKSAVFVAFAILGLHAVVLHPRELLRAATRPVFIAAYALLFAGLLVEIARPGGSLHEWMRIAEMVGGGVIIASFCRTPRDVNAALLGFLIASIWISLLLLTRTYGQVAGATVLDFDEASVLRNQASEEAGLRANWNRLAFISAAGAAIAATWAIWARSLVMRSLYAGIAALAALGTAMTFSRSGFIGLIGGLAVAAFSAMRRKTFLRMIALILLAAIVLWVFVPPSVRTRFSFEGTLDPAGKESRGWIYRTAVGALPDYFLYGVGAAEFWDSWAVEHGLHMKGLPAGSHNVFLQVTLYWGLAGLLSLLGLGAAAVISLRRATKRMTDWRALTAFAAVMSLFSLVTHSLFAKEFSITLGLIAAAYAISRHTGVRAAGMRRTGSMPDGRGHARER